MVRAKKTMTKAPDASELLERLGKPYQARFDRFRGRHAELLAAIGGATRVRLLAEPCGESRWMLSVVALDVKGALAIITGLLAARGVDVRNGDAFTLRPDPPAPAPRRPDRCAWLSVTTSRTASSRRRTSSA